MYLPNSYGINTKTILKVEWWKNFSFQSILL
jgi:hypothetical protein